MLVFGIRTRLIILGLAAGLMGALIILVTVNARQEANVARDKLSKVDSESFRIAEHFKDELREVNDRMRRYASYMEPAVWDEYLARSSRLKSWIEQQEPRLTTDRERIVLAALRRSFDQYIERAQELHHLLVSGNKTGASLPDYNSFFEQSRKVLDLGQELAMAHYESRDALLAQADSVLFQLRTYILALVALLFAFGLALAANVYRDLITPLKTKLVESEALLERNEKLASLGLLAAGVAHEIRNPLTAIKTALFLQQKHLQAGSPERRDSDVIEGEIIRLERIVNAFLQFARPARPEMTVLPAHQPLAEVQELLEPQLAASGIRLVREESPPLKIKVDAEQIKQVLINLVQNAADSISNSGTIVLRARSDRRKLAERETSVVVLEVSDTGKGIRPEVEKRLFDPFFTTKESGTGLGLPIAARIVERNGGALQYQTQVDRGSTFGIVLPAV